MDTTELVMNSILFDTESQHQNTISVSELKQMQALPLEIKIKKTEQRIIEWYEHFNGCVYVAFSGGKDSTVLLNIVRTIYPTLPAVYVNTGLEYPELNEFVKSIENVIELKPEKTFTQVIKEYGFPVVSKKVSRGIRDLRKDNSLNPNVQNLLLTGYNKNGLYCPRFKMSNKWKFLIDAPFKISEQCCDVMKKNPSKQYEKETGNKGMIGILASESQDRQAMYLKNGCNAYNLKNPKSAPLSFWTDNDILEYLYTKKIPYATVYGDIKETKNIYYTTGVNRTGCMFCMFGLQQEEEGNTRFDQMKITHPKIHDYCMNKLGIKEVIDYIKINIDNKTKKEVKQMEKGLLGKTQSTGFSKQLVIGEIVTVESFNEEMKIVQVVSNTTCKVDFIPANKFKLTPEEKAIQSAIESFNNSLTQDFTELEICKDLIESINDILDDEELSAPAKVREMNSYYTAFSRIILNRNLIVTPARPTDLMSVETTPDTAETK